jgi:glycosyltransferase involved in cell wall biosynthesis
MLVLSHVVPLKRDAGQEQRVYYTLRALQRKFNVTFATTDAAGDPSQIRKALAPVCDEIVLLASGEKYAWSKSWHRYASAAYVGITGLKASNYAIGRVAFPPSRLKSALGTLQFDCALFEYWHAARSTQFFQTRGIPCVLDMHNVLWQSYKRQLDGMNAAPQWWKRRALRRYQSAEEEAWNRFDAVIAINREEERYTRSKLTSTAPVFYAPMGIALEKWPYCWQPEQPPRIAYYGSLKSPHNQQYALQCCREIMPVIWERFPEAELWIVGGGPPDSIQELTRDPRVKVTGYVENLPSVLRTMSAVLCPWSGTYGFRSRIVEVMGVGAPVVASPDAVFGMDLEDGRGIALGRHSVELGRLALRLLEDSSWCTAQSRMARDQIECIYSFQSTYGRLAEELDGWLENREQESRNAQGHEAGRILS